MEAIYKIKIIDIRTDGKTENIDGVQVSERWLDVRFNVMLGDKVIEERSLGFPVNSSQEEINTSLKQWLNTYSEEKQMEIDNRKVDEEDKNVGQLRDGLIDSEIS